MSRHGKRAQGMVLISFAAHESLKKAVKRLAKAEKITPSEWMRRRTTEHVQKGLAALKKT